MVRGVLLLVLSSLLVGARPAIAQAPAPLEQFVRRLGGRFADLAILPVDSPIPAFQKDGFAAVRTGQPPTGRHGSRWRGGPQRPWMGAGAGLAGGYLYGKHEEAKQDAYQRGVYEGSGQGQPSSGSRWT